MPPGDFRRGFLLGLASELGRDDPALVTPWIGGLEAGDRALVSAAAATSWAEEDPTAAVRWALESDSPDALGGALTGWGGHDPEGAYRWLVGEMADQPDEVAGLVDRTGLFEQWTETDPASAFHAAQGFPEDLAPEKMGQVTRVWASEEPGAVSSMINEQLQPGPVRDAAVVALIEEIKDEDPNGAAAWARSLSDESRMYSVLDSLATQ